MAAQIGLRAGIGGRAAHVVDGDHELIGRVPLDQGLDDTAQHGALSASGVAEHQKVGIPPHQVEVDGGHRVLEESQRQEIGLLLAVGQVGRVDGLREHTDRRRTLAGPSVCDPLSQLLESCADAVRGVRVVGDGERGMGEELIRRQDAAGNVGP